jgi:hypothetical protein
MTELNFVFRECIRRDMHCVFRKKSRRGRPNNQMAFTSFAKPSLVVDTTPVNSSSKADSVQENSVSSSLGRKMDKMGL